MTSGYCHLSFGNAAAWFKGEAGAPRLGRRPENPPRSRQPARRNAKSL